MEHTIAIRAISRVASITSIPNPVKHARQGDGFRCRSTNPAASVDKNLEPRLTGPVNHGVLFKVICFAQNPSAAMRGGFLRWGVAKRFNPQHGNDRNPGCRLLGPGVQMS
jgi:hypothetical protein